jgi:hypothetical protein
MKQAAREHAEARASGGQGLEKIRVHGSWKSVCNLPMTSGRGGLSVSPSMPLRIARHWAGETNSYMPGFNSSASLSSETPIVTVNFFIRHSQSTCEGDILWSIVKGGSDVQIAADGTLSCLIATQYNLGLVKGGGNITIASSGAISCPVADQTGKLGLVKQGDNIVINEEGRISCPFPTATQTNLGLVKGGGNTTIDADGTLTGVGFLTSSTIPAPIQNTIGGVRRGGANIDIIDDGTISAVIPTEYITETLLTGNNYLTTIPVSSTGTVGGLKVDGTIHNVDNNDTLKIVEPDSVDVITSGKGAAC